MQFERPKFNQFFGKKEEVEAVFSFANRYKTFLNVAKTERESITEAIRLAQEAGYVDATSLTSVKPGDKLYMVNREKNLALFHIGENPIHQGINLVASHVDSPRLDLKPMPLQEDINLALLKTHYYGGIKKYQWVSKPLAIHGVVILKNGKKVEIVIGEEKSDPVFMIPDIEPHLSRHIQNDRKATETIKGEEMQLVVGSLPLIQDDKHKGAVKKAILKILNEKYGLEEADLFSAELSIVPASKARDVGFDRSLIGAYGHDDRSCAFTSLIGLLEQTSTPKKTAMVFLADKEEIGSTGSTGMQSDYFVYAMSKVLKMSGNSASPLDVQEMLWNSICISADVKPAFEPIFSSVYDESNSARLNGGPSITKYTGARGKSGASDADAELVAGLRALLSSANIPYQWGASGKVDEGGGGTVAKFVAHRGVRTIDLGLPMLSMHAPYELASKFDVYSYYQAMKAFFSQGIQIG
ncbi:aminopeptidase [Entomospira culicis]|uniref:M18 family aminopeptidase n=1 Tax=Entomospira culicis TaxID=2719989 RepID=A0A968GJ29_9SPIO|nr:aminopeptidase [Entomospira culicis]NIZ19655.1 aminopeptidase [Entomospira culicis]NIZ69869.1 aminopeptidase [Entomospira culicis]WDI36974.1 aminopeptidase [Entomospira culicis]WDI38603.1 aminopeptidase [Entomospira culicis]